VQPGHDAQRDRQARGQRDEPAGQGLPQRPAADRREVDLVPRQEHQHGQAQVRDRGDHLALPGPAEYDRAEQDTEQQLKHDRRDGDPAAEVIGNERCHERGREYHDASGQRRCGHSS
jgi:hypothetical protein